MSALNNLREEKPVARPTTTRLVKMGSSFRCLYVLVPVIDLSATVASPRA